MAKTLAQKFFIKPDQTLRLIAAPSAFTPLLSDLPAGVSLHESGAGPFDQVHAFCITQAELEERLPLAKTQIKPTGLIWLAYPKGSSKNYQAEINRDTIWEYALTIGLAPNHQIAIDEDWSSLRFKFVE